MGAVIPPSILMVIYGATAGVSIGALLIGGILPGVLMGLSLMVQSHVFAVKYDFPREHPQFLGLRAIWDGIRTAAWPLGVPVIIVVGMVGGVFTPTESASIAAVYSLFVTLLVFRSLTLAPAAASCSARPRSSSPRCCSAWAAPRSSAGCWPSTRCRTW